MARANCISKPCYWKSHVASVYIHQQHMFYQLTCIFANTMNISNSYNSFEWRHIFKSTDIFKPTYKITQLQQIILNYNIFLKTLSIVSITIYFFKMLISFTLAYISFSTSIYILFELKNFCIRSLFFLLAYTFLNQNFFFSFNKHKFQPWIFFSFSWNIFDKSKIHCTKTMYIFCKDCDCKYPL